MHTLVDAMLQGRAVCMHTLVDAILQGRYSNDDVMFKVVKRTLFKSKVSSDTMKISLWMSNGGSEKSRLVLLDTAVCMLNAKRYKIP